MPYQSRGNRRNNVQLGATRVYAGAVPRRIPESILDAIPGGLAWLALGVVVLGAIYAPMTMMLGAALLGMYSAVRFLFAGVAVLMGLRRIRTWEVRDWLKYYAKHANDLSLPLEKVHHVIIIPNYREELDTLRTTLDRLAMQPNALDAITIVLAMESGDPDGFAKGEILKAEYDRLFAHFFFPVHPKGLHNEIQCKSANQAWAARWARRQLVDEMGMNIHHIVVTTMDADTLWHPRHFEALGVMFALDDRRYSAFWQAPIRYHGNVWDINPFMRLLHAYSSAWELAYIAAPWWRALPMSSYSMSLKLLDNMGYWDSDVIADEWHMYIKSFFKREGDLVLRPMFFPFLACATTGKNVWDSVMRRYRQTLRHAWGAKEIGYAIGQMNEHPSTGFMNGFKLVFRVAHDNLLAGAGWVIITLGTQLPALLHPEVVRENSNALPFVLLQVGFLIVIVMTLFVFFVDARLRPPRPAGNVSTRKERFMTLLSIPMLPTITLICVAFPVVQAQTQLMLGMPLEFKVTKKN